MPWKECHIMDERLRFVARLLEGEKMAPLCAEFGISRKTGYKIYDRYKDWGVGAFNDQPSAASPGESPARTDRGHDRPPQTGVSGLGRAEDPREVAAAIYWSAPAGDQHRPRRPRSPPSGETPAAGAAPRQRHRALTPDDAQHPVVCRLQRRVPPRE